MYDLCALAANTAKILLLGGGGTGSFVGMTVLYAIENKAMDPSHRLKLIA